MLPMIESEVKEFIRRLPDLDQTTTHLSMMCVRSRYIRDYMNMKGSDVVVERNVIRWKEGKWRENYFQKIQNLEILQQNGHYKMTKSGNTFDIPHQAKAIYGSIIPRNIMAGVANTVNKLNNFAYAPSIVNDGWVYMSKLDVEFFASLHASKNKKIFNAVTVDIDEAGLYQDVRDMVSPLKVWMATKTARGNHIVLDLTNSKDAEEFYRGGTGIWPKIDAKYKGKVEIQRDPNEPVPGTHYYKKDDPNNHVRIIE